MTIVNLNQDRGESRQLYNIRYARTIADPESNVYLLATSIEDALDMFPAYYAAVETDPKVVPEDVTKETVADARRGIRSVERVATTILARVATNSGTCRLDASDLERLADDLQSYAGVSTNFEADTVGDGLHVLKINNADFYFDVDTGNYDGWGRAIEPGGKSGT